MVPLSQQFWHLLVTVGIGLVMGMIFDCYRVLRGLVKPNRMLTPVSDLLIWVVLTAIAFGLLIFGSWGEVRAYVFIGLALGVYLYWRLVSRYFIRGLRLMIKWLGRVIVVLVQVIVFPFKIAGRIVVIPIGLLSLGLRQVIRGLKAVGRRLCRPFMAMARRLFKKKDPEE